MQPLQKIAKGCITSGKQASRLCKPRATSFTTLDAKTARRQFFLGFAAPRAWPQRALSTGASDVAAPSNPHALVTNFWRDPKPILAAKTFSFFALFDPHYNKTFPIYCQWLGAILRRYKEHATAMIQLIDRDLSSSNELVARNNNVEDAYQMLLLACRVAWDLPEVKDAFLGVSKSAHFPAELLPEVEEVLTDEYPLDYVRSLALGPTITKMFLDTAIEDEDHSFWLIDAIWAQFYAVADDVPVRILLKTVVQILPELELENDPQKAEKLAIAKKFQAVALESLQWHAYENSDVILPMLRRLLETDKMIKKDQKRIDLVTSLISQTQARLENTGPRVPTPHPRDPAYVKFMQH